MEKELGYADSGHILDVEFDKKVVTYWWFTSMGSLLLSFIGIPLLIIWLPLGWFVHNKQFEYLQASLTDRSINIRKGWLFKTQQNIPLDKITDISTHEGPILNALGIVRMTVETAGSSPFSLMGVKNSDQFRDMALQQRDSLSAPSLQTIAAPSDDVLVEIRDILKNIESRLSDE